MGFCFFNNAAIAAQHARAVYGVDKVAVLDFDVHHGNGTEEGFIPDQKLFYGSTHEKGNFPNTGHEPKHIGSHAKKDEDRRIVNRFLSPGRKSVEQFRRKWREILEEMTRFGPNLVIISAGFDAHDADPLASCELHEEDFEWATMLVLDACKEMSPESPVPCLSVLEGGYDLEALTSSAVAHVRTLFDYSAEMRGISEAKQSVATGGLLSSTTRVPEISTIDAIVAAMNISSLALPTEDDCTIASESKDSGEVPTIFSSCEGFVAAGIPFTEESER